MRALISQELIKNIRSGKEEKVNAARKAGRPIEIRDERLTGLILRVQPSGSMSFICQYARGQRMTLGNVRKCTPEAARVSAKKMLGTAAAGDDPRPERARHEHTLESFLEEEYEPWVKANRKDGAGTVARLRTCFAEFFAKKLAEISPWIVEKWRTARLKDGKAPATVNRDLDDIKALLAKAVEWEKLDAHPLARKVKRSKVDNERVRFLSKDEEERLRAALDRRQEGMREERERFNRWRRERGYAEYPSLLKVAFTDHLKPMVLLSMNTGLRQGELFLLEWSRVDLERAILTVRANTTKTTKTRHLPLNEEVLGILKGWRRDRPDTSMLVFPSSSRSGESFDNVAKSWKKLLAEADISDFRWHDMRHHFASWLVMAGVDLNTVRELLGHSDIKMTLRYAHLAPEHKAAAVARLVRKPAAVIDLEAGEAA